MAISPLDDRVVLKPLLEEAKGVIVIPDSAKEKPTKGEVIAVGPGRWEKGARVPTGIEVGQVVLYGQYAGIPYTHDSESVVIIRASELLGTL